MIRARRLALAVVVGLLTGGLATAQSARTESAVWLEIIRLRDTPEPSGPQWFDHAVSRRRVLLAEIANLLLLFPGSAHREAAVALEMDTRWELFALDEKELAAFRERLSELDRNPPNPQIAAETRYWRLRLDRGASPKPPTDSSPAVASAPSAAMFEAGEWARFLADFPDSPRTPAVVHELLSTCERNRDFPAAERHLSFAQQHCASDPTTRIWTGRLRRWRNIGRPIVLDAGPPSGSAPATGPRVVWHLSAAALTPVGARAAQWPKDVERLSATSVRQTAVLMGPAQIPAALPSLPNLAWRSEPLGLSGEYARDWGITRLPTVFVISADGRLESVSEDESDIRRAIGIDTQAAPEKTTPASAPG